MAEKVIKLDIEDVEKIKTLQLQFIEVTNKIGEISIQEENLKNMKNDLLEQKESLIKDYYSIKNSEKELINEVGKKYGFGRLNISTGELTITE